MRYSTDGLARNSGLLGAFALFVLLIVVIGSRLIGLDHLAVWHDEVFTLVRVLGYPEAALETLFGSRLLTPGEVLAFQQPDPSRGWGDTLRALAEHPEHAPLYYLLGRVAILLPLDPVTAVRGTSALFGILLPAAAFWLMRELFGRGPIPWVAAVIVAFSPLHLLYAQEARQYALWTLLVLASCAALQRALDRKGRRDWWLYGLTVVLGLYSHLLFALMLPVHALYGLLGSAREPGHRFRRLDLPIRPWLVSVTLASILFLPWVLVLLAGFGDAVNHTQWMDRAAGAQRNLLAWGGHIVRAFFDWSSSQEVRNAHLLLLIPIAVAIVWFLVRAPRPRAWLLVLIALAYPVIVLGPDLLLGGSRSLHVRYGLPSILAVQLMAAWSIGAALARGGKPGLVGASGLAFVVILGTLSLWRIQQAETWWNKHFSGSNVEVARMVNAFDSPLVAASPSGVAAGELISLAYRLDDHVRIWGHGIDANPVILPEGFGTLVLLLPSEGLQAAVGSNAVPERIGGTWQWYLAGP
jgi:uncharacterized membrane protein